jgi:glycosyltransferase involved in cell wall biosynthesis
MHIALVNRWYPPYTGFGGVAAYDYYLAHALAKQGHQVMVLAARWSADVPEVQQDGPVCIHRLLATEWSRLKHLPMLGCYARPLQQYIYSQKVARALHQMDAPDVVEFAEVNAEGYHYLRQSERSRVVVRCHTPNFVLCRYYTAEEMPFDTSWTARMEADCIRRADALSAPSQDMAGVIARDLGISPDSFTVIPNALDVRSFISPAGQLSPFDTVTILHVGRLERVKGIETLARAFAIVHQQVPQARMVFVGDDRPDGAGSTWRARLESQFREQGLGDAIQFTGGVDQAELLRWYQRADIAVVPSMLYESFSYTCAQAMAAGLPVVGSRIGGIPETIGDAGKLVEAGNVPELAIALLELANNLDLRLDLGQKAQRRALDVFDAEIVATRTLELYKKLRISNEQ